MQVAIQCAPKALHKRNAARLGVSRPSCRSLPNVPVRHDINEDAEDRREKTGVARHQKPKIERHRQHPLAHRYVWQYMLHEMRSGIGGGPRSAAGTQSSLLTRERYENINAAALAACAGKSTRKDAALQVLPECLFYVPREPTPIALSFHGDKRLEFLAHDTIEESRFRSMSLISLTHTA